MPRTTQPPTVWLNLREAAETLGVSQESVRRYIARGHLPAYRLPTSRLVRVKRADLDAFIAAGELPTAR